MSGALPNHHRPSSLAALPIPATPLFGRERDAAAVRDLLIGGHRRIVTLTGPGGVGKTRLAIRLAAGLADHFADGVCFVPLAAVADPSLMLHAVATALKVGPHQAATGDCPWLAGLLDALRDSQMLIVLDNAEHLATAFPHIAALLAGCPALRVLVTSRVRLHLSDEQEYAVSPLPIPPSALTAEAAGDAPAVALFLERARAVRPTFSLTAANIAAVVDICRRLDGLPLALELAAARIAHLSPAALLDRLDRRFSLLTGGPRDAPARHRTMRDAIAWSVDLLDATERSLFARLAVFAGGCTIEAADAVCRGRGLGVGGQGKNADSSLTPDSRPLTPDVLDGISSLLDKNLLRRVDDGDGEPRYAMLETIREYGQERLAASGEERAIRGAHADYVLALAEQAEPHVFGPSQVAWLNRLEAELPNLRAALSWLREQRRAEDGLRLAGALWQFWWRRGYLREGRTWFATFLATSMRRAPVRVRALIGAGELASWQKNHEQAAAWFAEAAELARELGDEWGVAMALRGLGTVAIERGEPEQADALLDESFARFQDLADTWGAGRAKNMQGVAALTLSDYSRAAVCFRDSLAMFRECRDWWYVSVALEGHGMVALIRGDNERARRAYADSLAMASARGDRTEIAWSLIGIAGVAVADGQAERAAILLGASAALRRALGARLQPIEQSLHDRIEAAARASMGAVAFLGARERGSALPFAEVVAEATAIGDGGPAPRRQEIARDERPPTVATGGIGARLTSREKTVLRRLVEGLSDREIADELSLSPRTVSAHVGNILAKFDVSTRTAATAFALRERLV
jgi:non-specific serine/threonine protein kinase